MMATIEPDSSETLSMLDERLRRLEFLVHGETTDVTSAGRSGEASTQVSNAQRTIQALASKSHAAAAVLNLHRQYPELFHPTGASSVPADLAPSALAQILLAHEEMYKLLAAQLVQLQEANSVPDPNSLAQLVALQSRIDEVKATQMDQVREFAELRARSARAVEGWYETGVLQMGERWADWDERLRDCEILVRRKEAAKKRQEGVV